MVTRPPHAGAPVQVPTHQSRSNKSTSRDLPGRIPAVNRISRKTGAVFCRFFVLSHQTSSVFKRFSVSDLPSSCSCCLQRVASSHGPPSSQLGVAVFPSGASLPVRLLAENPTDAVLFPGVWTVELSACTFAPFSRPAPPRGVATPGDLPLRPGGADEIPCGWRRS